ncbi:hypothetical protein EYF80_041449 [Liparis tanakae]|uniref:Uncharacterized protein n=1 Tax=Liparis tanakae TaxID=230148 RepID=A0A4Z2G521_9TELE|nr:hypothetical protein EYF80_041449 [Liparis tanakae]
MAYDILKVIGTRHRRHDCLTVVAPAVGDEALAYEALAYEALAYEALAYEDLAAAAKWAVRYGLRCAEEEEERTRGREDKRKMLLATTLNTSRR